MRKHLILFLLMSLQLLAHGQTIAALDSLGLPHPTVAKSMRYWFDDDSGSMTSSDMQESHHIIDVSALADGLHTVNYQIIDDKGSVGIPYSSVFLKLSSIYEQSYSAVEAKKLIYWYDEQEANTIIDLNGGVQMLDVSALQDGLHTVNYQIIDNKGRVGIPYSSVFLKLSSIYDNPDSVVEARKLIYWYDEQEANTIIDLNGSVQMLDVSALQDGMHTLHYMVVCSDGTVTSAYSSIFLILNNASIIGTQESMIAEKMRYWFDEEIQYKETELICGAQSLDVSNLSDGFHSLHYQLVDRNGDVSVPYSSLFLKMKEPELVEGKNVITRCVYWLNDHSKYVNVDIPNPSNPYQLIALVPIEKAPIRSSCFHFEAKEGEPMIYAKNDIHFRFYDAADYWTDDMRTFVDYSVSQKITDITPLQETQTFDRPEENGIKWFSFEAEKGDSVTFCSSLATSLQLFNEKGDVCYEAQGFESVLSKGTHLTENGTYYLAVHDVTGHADNSISLQFIHIGKFALLETSNPSLGVMPSVQIFELEGNGFDNLKNVKLLGQSSIIMPDSISILARAKARLYFLFDGNEKLGLYDLILNFDDGEDARDIQRSEYVELAEPSFENIEIAISDPRAVADPYPVYIKVTNNSNIAYQAVPFYFAIDHIERMQSVQFMDFVVGCSEELYEAGLQLSFEYDSFMGNNIKTKVVPTVIPEILPGETLTFTLGVRTGANQEFNVYAWTGKPWSLLIPETQDYISRHYSDIRPARSKRRAPGVAGIFDGCQDDPCELAGLGPDYTECACGMALALGGTLGGIQNGIQNSKNKKARELYELNGFSPDDYPIRDRYLPSPEDLIWFWVQHCLPGHAGEVASAYNTGRQTMGNNPCQDPPPHPTNPYYPGDPNEIHGYMSEAGSKYIRKEVLDVSYAIEFENDPELANASAHKILISDTLDIRIFDPSTFRPTSVKIGDKSVELEGSQNSIQTLDMRPEINAIAQIVTEFDQQSGIAKWILSSLDPMSMEETYDIMQGILPINNEGNGVGFVNYDIQIKQPLEDGASFANRASIVFDFEDPILTPIWTNIVDAVAPTGSVIEVTQHGDSAIIVCDGTDVRSGIWKYEVYTQPGMNAPWQKVGECFADSAMISYEVFGGLDYGFCALAVDSAGNVEQKKLVRELSLTPVGILGDVNGDNSLTSDDVTSLVKHLLQMGTIGINISAADVNQDGEISVGDVLKLIKMIEDSQGQKNQSPQRAPIFINSKQEDRNDMQQKKGTTDSIPRKNP